MTQFLDGISVELLRACFRYDPRTGGLFWKVRAGGRRSADIGDAAAIHPDPRGYLRVQIFGRLLFAHKVAWAIHHGAWPDSILDHINRDRADNRIENLRLATHSQNGMNSKKISKPCTSQFRGVGYMPRKRKWRARLGRAHLGLFDTEIEAAREYDRIAREVHGEFANTNFNEEKVHG